MLRCKNLINLAVLIALSGFSSVSMAASLLEAVELGLAHNLALKASELSLDESQKNIGISRSKFLPSINASADTIWNKNRQYLNGVDDEKVHYNSHNYGISLAQDLINIPALYQYQSALIGFSLEEIKHEGKKQSTILAISSEYIAYLKNRAEREATEMELHSATDRERQMRRNIELGNTAGNELYEVLGQKERIANQLRGLNKDKKIILASLAELTRHSVIPSEDLLESVELKSIDSLQSAEILKQSLAFNQDVLIAEKELAKSRVELNESQANFYPKVSLSASYRHDDSNNFDDLDLSATGKSDSTTVGINLLIPIFSGGSDYYGYQQAGVGLSKQFVLRDESWLNTKTSVLRALLTINDLADAIGSFERIVLANHASYIGIQRAYQLGTRTITDLLAAETKLFNALRDHQSARYDYVLETLTLTELKGLLSVDALAELMSLMEKITPRSPDQLLPSNLLEQAKARSIKDPIKENHAQ